MRGLRVIINHFRHAKSNMALVAGVLVFGALAFSGMGALSQNSAQAASPNDIVYGGIYNRDLASKCTGDVKTIMDHYRIDCNLAGVVDGRACRDNNVYVGNEVVASNSTSIGRQQKSGDHAISIGGKTYWEGSNSTAFAQECLDVFVKMDPNGGFVYAIIKACGNPIWTPNPKPPKPPTPPTPPQVKYIQVCELATKKIISIKETDFNSEIHSKNLADCKEKLIQVCELATNTIVTIKEEDYNTTKYSKDLNACKPIQVCELATNKIIYINEKDFDATKHSKDLKDCETIQVCELATKKTVTIKAKDYDTTKHSKNFDDCKEQCVENPKAGITCTAPAELPKTGFGDMMGASLGIGSLTAAGSAYAASRKDLFKALRRK